MNARAVLRTNRNIKEVQYFSPNVDALAVLADSWLDVNGKPGDRFELLENKEMLIRTIAFTQPTVITEATQESLLRHAFTPGSGTHCDKCGAPQEAHP